MKITLAIISPLILASLACELVYLLHLDRKLQGLSVFVFAIVQLVSLVILFRTVKWKLWINIVAAIPFTALSLAVAVYVMLLIAAGNGDAI